MNSYDTYVIAFLDILGFKNLIKKGTFHKVMEIFQNIITDEDAGIVLIRATDGESGILERYNDVLSVTKFI